MAGMGPPPKHPDHRARRNATVAMTQLPADGRKGRAPKWPLGADVQIETEIALLKLEIRETTKELEFTTTARDRASQRRKIARAKEKLAKLEAMKKAASAIEKEIWAALWKTPQSTQWERRGWFREVALFARVQARAETGSLDDAKEARAREDRLGLNDQAMLRLRWEVAAPAATQTGPTKRSTRNSSKYRDLRVVS